MRSLKHAHTDAGRMMIASEPPEAVDSSNESVTWNNASNSGRLAVIQDAGMSVNVTATVDAV